jgi:Spy/CpxP family protein refolding chaperone
MKLTKTLALAALVAGSLLAGNTALQAQDTNTNTPPAGRPGGPGMRGRLNLDNLGLTDEVKTKVQTILTEQRTNLRALSNLTPDERKAKAKEIREATTAKLKEILTAEQFEKLQKQMQGNRPPGSNAKPATPPQQ